MTAESTWSAWINLERLAKWSMEHPGALDPHLENGWIPKLRLWYYFSRDLGVRRSYTVFLRGQESMVREVDWHFGRDRQRVLSGTETLTPTLGVRDAGLPYAELIGLLLNGDALSAPLFGKVEEIEYGSEGGEYGLEVIEDQYSIRLNWSEAGPAKWRPINVWVYQMRSFLWNHLGQHES